MNNKKILSLSLIGVVLLGAIFYIVYNNGKGKVAESFQPIENAQANSYEPAEGTSVVKENDNLIGSKDALLKIFVYEDYASSYSAELAKTLETLISENDGKIAVITRAYVDQSTVSRKAALAVMCAKDSGKWEEMRKLLLSSAKDGVILDEAFSTYAAELQMNVEEFNNCLTNEEKSVKLDESMRELKDALVLGAPTMIVGDEMILGARPYGDFIDSNGDAIEGLKTLVERKLGEVEVK